MVVLSNQYLMRKSAEDYLLTLLGNTRENRELIEKMSDEELHSKVLKILVPDTKYLTATVFSGRGEKQ